MANSAFRISEGKRYESSYGECSGSTLTINQSNHDSVTKISDIMTLKYENNQCPVVGDVVRWSSVTTALTLADAEYNAMTTTGVDPEASSEVVGVIEEVINACGPDFNRGEVTARIVFFGKIDFSNHMGNKKLTPGKVYYLNDSTEVEHNSLQGHIFRNATSREPQQVSKPVYIATGLTTAIVTNFRGLMGGQSDYVMDEILLTIDCENTGFLVTIKNNGSETWKTPIDSISSELDPLDGSSTVGQVQKTWGGYNEFNEWVTTEDPTIQTSTLLLVPGESVTYKIGSAEDPKIGKLTVLLKSNNQVRTSESRICIPELSIHSECADIPNNDSNLPRFLISWDTQSRGMTTPITYTIQEKDDTGQFSDIDTQDFDSFQLPSSTDDASWYINVYDKFNPSHSGDYRIIFPDVVPGHWAYPTLGDGLEMSCITDIKCTCETTHCLIEPRYEEKRKTYGPLMGAYELDGITLVGDEDSNRTKYPGLIKDMLYDVTTGETIDMWQGKTDRLNDDGTNGRLCGSLVEDTPYFPSFTFYVPDSGAICVPKLTFDKVRASTPYVISVWKNKQTREIQNPASFQISLADVPKNEEDAVGTFFLNYNSDTGEYEHCFDFRLDGSSQDYYIDEIVT